VQPGTSDVAELRQHVWDALVALKNQPQLLISFIFMPEFLYSWDRRSFPARPQ